MTIGVDAVDAAGNASAQSSVTATPGPCGDGGGGGDNPPPVPPPDTTPPSTPAGVSLSAVSQTAAKLSWSASTDNVGVAGYRLYRNGIAVGNVTRHELHLHRARRARRPTRSASPRSTPQATSPARSRRAPRRSACAGDSTPPSTPTGLATSAVGADVRHALLDGVDRQRRRHRLPAVPRRVGGRNLRDDELQLHGPDVRHDVHARRRRGRCRRQRLRHRLGERRNRRVPRHHPALQADRPRHERCRPDLRDPVLDGVDRQRRRHRLPALPGRQPGRHLVDDEFQLHRPDCGTTYTLGVAAVDAAGNVSGTATANVATAACPDTTPPSTPTGLATSAVGQTSATLSWTASTDNVGVTGYRLFQGGTQVGTSATTSFNFTGLTCGTTYTLGVAAVDAAGNVSGTATANVATAACPDTTPPSTPTGLATSAVGQTSATLSWTASTDNVGVTGYRRLPGRHPGRDARRRRATASRGSPAATTYTLGVAAVDAAGNVSGTATTSVTTDRLPATRRRPRRRPASPRAQSARPPRPCPGRPRPTTSPSPATGFPRRHAGRNARPRRATTTPGSPAGPPTRSASPQSTPAGNVSGTATKSVTTTACTDTTPPSTPTGLATSAIGQTSVRLSWTASTDNVAVTGYRLFRDGTQVGTPPPRATTTQGSPAAPPTPSASPQSTPPATSPARRRRASQRPPARTPRPRRHRRGCLSGAWARRRYHCRGTRRPTTSA